MLTFNDLLRVEDVDPADVRLVRHESQRLGSGRLYAAWRDLERRHLFEEYQSLQGKDLFPVGTFLASFVVMPRPRRATLFVGVYAVRRVKKDRALWDPLVEHRFAGYRYDLALLDTMRDYVGRLTIDWGSGTRSWIQRANRQAKPVLAIQSHEDPPWPGFAHFHADIDEIPGLYDSWQQVLRTVKGVYLLVDHDTGEQYVGSAKGDESLLGRFLNYAETGHGGNVELKRRPHARYRVSLLEVVDLSLPDRRLEEIEAAWKDKLMTREYGLNRN